MRSTALALIACTAFASLPTTPAAAALVTGDRLHAACSANEESRTYGEDIAWCRAYISGVYDDLMATREMDKKDSCEPAGLTPTEVVDTILKNMRDQPAFHDGAASNLVRVSIIGAWPACSEVTEESSESGFSAAE
jgi:hypothetical protein